jgi:S1-C subfamily serine protease
VQLKLAIIHMGMVVETLELEPGEYSLGRGSHNNIVVQHFSLEPEHGRIFFKDERWFYGNVEGTQQSALTSQSLISLTPQISLSTQEYVESAESEIRSFTVEHGRQQSKIKQRMVVAAASVVLLLSLVSIGYLAVRSRPDNVQQSQLINTVRDKIVEFESNRDDQAIDQIKKYAGLSDADFKETSGFCTGFLVGPNIVLTAAHCLFGTMVIDINNDFYLKTSDGKSHQIKRVLGFDVKRDFLFLETEGMESYGYLDFADGYDIEQKVYTVGNVHGEGIAIRDGIVSSETADADEPDVKFLRYSAGTSPGNSGGPLVNSDGEVVALVFASTSTENFNLGTPTQYLQQAYETYVEGVDEPKTIEVSMKRVLNFKPALMVSSLSLPYLPQFDEYPEISREFNDVQFEVQVPMDFATVDEAVLEPLNSKVIETFFKVQNFLKQKNEPVLDWKSFVSKKNSSDPAITI